MTKKTLEIEKIVAIGEEIEASFIFIKEGINILNSQKSTILNNHVPLQLLASGFERLAKILLLLKEKYVRGSYPMLEGKKNYFSDYNNGHGINKMVDELITYSETVKLMRTIPIIIDDMKYLKTDIHFKKFLDIITDFSIQQRYYYIDTIVKMNRPEKNCFADFKMLIYSYSVGIDVSSMTYEEEERYNLTSVIITIEKGVRAISRFFTHGLGDEGRKHYGDYSSFILLNNKDLGKLNYLKPKIDPQKDYHPINKKNTQYTEIILHSKTKIISSSDYSSWPFLVEEVEVINYKTGFCCFVEINNELFALNGNAVSHFKIPNYSASKYLNPRQERLDLLSIAKNI